MKKNDYYGIFCLHPKFEEQWSLFEQNKYFHVYKNCFDQKILIKASLLITDYSSIFFDFGYIKKPIIYSQFDIKEYRIKQFREANFNYHKDGFGPVCNDLQCIINNAINSMENNCQLNIKYLKRINDYFGNFDDSNSARIFKMIIFQ